MDLTKGPPRSPRDTLGGMTFLPRTIDKMRAHLAGTLGEYKAKVGYSERLFAFLDVTADEFEAVVAAHADDAGVLAALMERAPRGAAEIEAFNEQARSYPQDEAARQRHQMLLEEAGYGDRTDITTMFDRLDLDDGRDVPVRS